MVLFYYFDDDNLSDIEEELRNIAGNLGNKFGKARHLLNNGYSSKDLENFGLLESDISEFADFELGIKIRRCIKRKGYCEFEAEL